MLKVEETQPGGKVDSAVKVALNVTLLFCVFLSILLFVKQIKHYLLQCYLLQYESSNALALKIIYMASGFPYIYQFNV